RVHRLDPLVIVEMPGLRRHERRAVEEDALRCVHALAQLVARLAVTAQQLEPFAAEHVRMHVDYRHLEPPALPRDASKHPRGRQALGLLPCSLELSRRSRAEET